MSEMSVSSSNSSIKVAVSGVTGFIGAQVAADLLKRGYTVHGTVRKKAPERIAHLSSFPHLGSLSIFEADLEITDSFDNAVADCDYAIHVASPFASDVPDPQRDLVDPAVNGTLNFLRSCHKAGIKKVVLTSSLAAISDGGIRGKVFDENDWNEHSSLKFLPYYYSKVMAERAAWDFVEEEAPEMRLVVINPVIVLGPSLVKSLNESATIVKGTVEGEFGGILGLSFPVVDVRDVSKAHIRAMESETASGRYICYSGEMLTHKQITDVARSMGFKAPKYDLSGSVPSKVIKLATYFAPGRNDAQFTRKHIRNPIIPTNAKIVRELGMTFMPISETLRATFNSMVHYGHIQKTKAT